MKNLVQKYIAFKNVACYKCFQAACYAVTRTHVKASIQCRFYTNLGNTRKFGDINYPVFKPKKIVILSRITRYEFEKIRYKDITEEQFKNKLEKKRSDYHTLVERHNTHYSCLKLMTDSLRKNDIEAVVVTRPEFTRELLDWADIVFTAGGDGTFLDAASKILTKDKPIIGFNTDPTRSEGKLCLSKDKYSATNIEDALQKLLKGEFRWQWRQRIRITISGCHANDDPIELSDQQLKLLEHRFTEHVAENEDCSRPFYLKSHYFPRLLPVRALNEVFFGECLSSRVSYYEMSVDDGPGLKQKSSGVTVCTGTGSSSWHFHINQIPKESVRDILSTANDITGLSYPLTDESFIETVKTRFNDSLLFNPSDPYMGYTIRDPINNGVLHVPFQRGKAKKIQISSRMWDASLVLDGGSSFRFNDGAIATLEILDEDALRTVDLE